MPSEFMTNKEAAVYLRTSTLTLWRLRRGGQLPFYRIASKVLYRRCDLDDYSEQQRRNGGQAINESSRSDSFLRNPHREQSTP